MRLLALNYIRIKFYQKIVFKPVKYLVLDSETVLNNKEVFGA